MSLLIALIEGTDQEFTENITSRLQKAGCHIKRYKIEELVEDEQKGDVKPCDITMEGLPDLLLIDIDDVDFDVAVTAIRIRTYSKPLPYPVIATSYSPSLDKLLKAFAAGANDYVAKDVPAEELVARINNLVALFRRIEPSEQHSLKYNDLRIEIKQHKVFRAGEEISLTPKEFELLLFLARHSKKVCSREMLLQEVWGYDFTGKTNVVDVYIKHIRTKIDKGRRHKLLHTVRGAGYMLQ